MAYCTLMDIKKLLAEDIIIQLTDDDNLHVVNDAAVAEAIASADAEIDGYCAVKYTVPFANVPAIIKALSIDISIHNLYKRRTVPERIETAYDKAIAKLKDISRGLVSLGEDPPPASSAAADGAACSNSAGERIFTMDKMTGF